MGCLGGSAVSARGRSWLQVGFRSEQCVILDPRTLDPGPWTLALQRQCCPRQVLLMADHWMQKSPMQAHVDPVHVAPINIPVVKKKATQPRSIPMGQGV